MSNLFDFLSRLNQRGIKIRVERDQLRINAPQGTITPELTAELRARKPEIIAFLNQNRVGSAAAPIERVDRAAPLPLSFSQQRVWFLEQLGSGATYTIPAAFRLRGCVNVPALQQALSEVVRRHESLRTTFEQLKGPARQVVHAPTALPLSRIKLPPGTPDKAIATALRLAAEETLRPFDLSADLLIRATLFELDAANQDHVLLLTLHHIAADGWSMGVLGRELAELYAAFVAGHSSPLPELSIQYADFAAWQRSHLQGERLEELLTYWKKSLAGVPELLQLPTDHPRPPIQTLRANKVNFRIDATLTQRLRRVSQDAGATLFMTLLAAFHVLLARYSGQEDVVVDTPIASRNHSAIEPLIGHFVNDLALRADLSSNPTFLELLEQVRQTTQAAYQHQDLPFDRVVEALQPRRNLGYHPITQVFFALQNASTGELKLSDIDVQPLDLFDQGVEQTRMDLEVHLSEREDGLAGSWLYSADLFERDTITRMIGHFLTLLETATSDPAQRVYDLAMLTPAERQQLLVAWNATETSASESDVCRDKCLHQLFEAQVDRTPNAVALLFDEQRLSYRELNERANQLAHRLQGLGVGPETMVALCVERSLEMVVGLLGILKAGAAYVPLDPDYPAERTTFILQETGAPVVVTQARLRSKLPVGETQVVELDNDTTNACPPTNPSSAVAPHHLAYVMYTSGSTGKPKGVLIEHESVAAHCVQYCRFYGLQPTDRVLVLASFHFDASVEQIFPALLTGASVVVSDVDLDPVAFSQSLLQSRITILDLAGAHLGVLLRAWIRNPELLAGSVLRIVNVGADVMPVELVSLWRQTILGKQARLFNVYGPTETTVAAAVFDVTETFDTRELRIPIGPPLANKKFYVLDRRRQPAPIGVPGELYIGGIGPARGYLHRAELTAERFTDLRDLPLTPTEIEAGFIERNGRRHSRLYRTGDLVRWLPDGTIDFLGRADHQVKIRSFRVELGEIEAVLCQHRLVHESAVLVRDDAAGRRRLIAYLSPQLSDAEIAEVREFMRVSLPEYMVPDAFVSLDGLPKTSVGKLDRRALPDVGVVRSTAHYVAPSSIAEEKVLHAWQQVLNHQELSVHDNFFDVGGHSLAALEVHGLLHPEFPALRMVDLFSYPTIHSLASYLDQGTSRESVKPSPRRQRKGPPESRAIAIVGLAGRFPAASDIAEFWRNLRDGRAAAVSFSDEQLLAAGVDPSLLQNPHYVKSGTIVPNIEYFDAEFFKMNALDAAVADPQHRIFLECVWQALEHAGYPPAKTEARVGLYAGVGENTYRQEFLEPNGTELLATVGAFRMATLNSADFLATHVAYKLNLTGPVMTVQTGCSTSLVAVHMACQSLLNAECDLCLAGGVSVFVPQGRGYLYQDGMIHSPDGYCRAFDAQAQGTIAGGGVGVVVLKRLDEAITDGDTIHGVILGSAINNDGGDKIGFTAPSTTGQTKVIADALAAAGVSPEEISYIEAHGTGTPMGDPIEVEALTRAFREGTQQKGFCAIGSVKTAIGHADTAAGVAGLIKTVLALGHRQLPPSLNFKTPNPQIDFANSPFFVNDQLRPWTVNGNGRRCAGVSAFGIGGTNAHVIVAEAPASTFTREDHAGVLLRLSAKTQPALNASSGALAKHFKDEPDVDLPNVAHTLHAGRQDFAHRRIVVCRDAKDAAALLEGPDNQWAISRCVTDVKPEIVFTFPGGGAQYVNMGRGLYEASSIATFAPYKEHIDRCLDIFRARFGFDLKPFLFFPLDGVAAEGCPSSLAEAQRLLEKPALAYPALFIVEYALARLWQSWGIEPAAMIGHSMGEYLAACLAGVFTLEDALSIVTWRGQLYETMRPGAMISVGLSEADLAGRLHGDVAIAAVNKHNLCTVSGPVEAIEQLERALTAEGVLCKRIRIAFAGHSPMQEAILPEFRRRLEQIRFSPPQLPFISNVTGTWIRPEDAMSPDYWIRHLRNPVRFSDGVGDLMRLPHRLFLEVGPGQTLGQLVRGHADKQAGHIVLSSMRHHEAAVSDTMPLLLAVGQLWLSGIDVSAPLGSPVTRGRRIPLPTYPFERKRHWMNRMNRPTLRTPEPKLHVMATKTLPDPPKTAPLGDEPQQTNRPLSDIERVIADVWSQSLGVSDMGPSSDFFMLGGDSLLATQVAARLRVQLNVELDTHSLLQAPTVAELATLIATRNGQSGQTKRLPDLVVELQAGDPSQTPLFLMHPVGGHVYFYRQLVRHLDSKRPVYGIRARGVEGEAEPLTSIAEMAQVYTAAVQVVQPRGPYCLGGSSFGGTLAYEMAQQLLLRGEHVAYLALLDTPSPGNMLEPFENNVDILFYMLKVGANADIELQTLRAMDEQQQLEFFLRENPNSFASVNELKIMLNLFKTNEHAMAAYEPIPYSGKLHFFLARDRDAFNPQTPAYGWIGRAAMGIEIITVPGNHNSMHEAPHVHELAGHLEQTLRQALARYAIASLDR